MSSSGVSTRWCWARSPPPDGGGVVSGDIFEPPRIEDVTVTANQACFSSQRDCCDYLFSFFFLNHCFSSPEDFQHHFNKSEKGCKQKVRCVVQIEIGGLSEGPCRDIKATRIASTFHSNLFLWRAAPPERCWPTFSHQTSPLEP